MAKLEKGCLQIYTGDGKGKTTAALGLAVRASGNGLKVYMVQFLKSGFTGELSIAEKLKENFKIIRFGKKRGFFWTLNEGEKLQVKDEVQEAYRFCLQALRERQCDILIMDEIMGTISNGLVTKEQILELIEARPKDMELILTGRYTPEEIIEKADLVTEMKKVKHYFDKAIAAREGIEY